VHSFFFVVVVLEGSAGILLKRWCFAAETWKKGNWSSQRSKSFLQRYDEMNLGKHNLFQSASLDSQGGVRFSVDSDNPKLIRAGFRDSGVDYGDGYTVYFTHKTGPRAWHESPKHARTLNLSEKLYFFM
jgi:hypothetical protein